MKIQLGIVVFVFSWILFIEMNGIIWKNNLRQSTTIDNSEQFVQNWNDHMEKKIIIAFHSSRD